MATSITEKILSSNKFYTDRYLKDSINLTKSISFVNKDEAQLYNEYITQKYSSFQIDYANKSTWRYYLHLTAQYHPVDTPITLVSLDNGETITLSQTTINLHRTTRAELLKFDLVYKELVDRFPEQELLIKAIIATSTKKTIADVIASENYEIVSYNASLVEANEDDLIATLQERIDNYKVTKLIGYYALSDNLFLASQYHIFYTFLLQSLIAIRLANAKTLKAHSYHILNYLSSHHYLDIQYEYLTPKQALFLYRNLLYIDNHVGQENIFRLLIDRLFTERNMSVVSYEYTQGNTTDADNQIQYTFKQNLLNSTNLVYSYQNFTLEDIKTKEYPLSPGNANELTYHLQTSDQAFKNSLFSTLMTKDLETIVVDNTDSVPYKLVPTLIDYWAYLLKTDQINFLVTVLDPLTNQEIRLTTADLFKLFTLTLFKQNGQTLTHFPTYTIQRVYKPTLPTKSELFQTFYKKHHYHEVMVDEILAAVPPYSRTITSYQFQQYISSVYQLNIGIWLYLSNLSDKHNDAQFTNLVANLHTTDTYSFDNETPTAFLDRIGLESLFQYTDTNLESLSFSILNNLYDKKLAYLNRYKYIQQALIEVFKKFNSYTVQLIDKYTAISPLLAGPHDPRFGVREDIFVKSFRTNVDNTKVEAYLKTKESLEVFFHPSVDETHCNTSRVPFAIDSFNEIQARLHSHVSLSFKSSLLNGVIDLSPTPVESSENLVFLALNT